MQSSQPLLPMRHRISSVLRWVRSGISLECVVDRHLATERVALVAGILDDLESKLDSRWYQCNGAQSINHATSFQDYLEKYFGFRKAYCQPHVVYKQSFGLLIKDRFTFHRQIERLDGMRVFHLPNSVLKMEEIARC